MFKKLKDNESIKDMRPGLINLYKSVIEMAEYRIKILEDEK